MKPISLIFALLLTGCAQAPPTPFERGAQTSPLPGCIDYRLRGGQC